MGKYHTNMMENITASQIISLQDTIKKKDREIAELKAKLKLFDDWEVTENMELKHKTFGILRQSKETEK